MFPIIPLFRSRSFCYYFGFFNRCIHRKRFSTIKPIKNVFMIVFVLSKTTLYWKNVDCYGLATCQLVAQKYVVCYRKKHMVTLKIWNILIKHSSLTNELFKFNNLKNNREKSREKHHVKTQKRCLCTRFSF